ncbi:MAG: hypothetical protein KGJ07_06200 [Patescibacteria group bacterium]|nr:hypothetical protein [Patescibacteria group bacterium]
MSYKGERSRGFGGERPTYVPCFPVGQSAAQRAFREFVADSKSPHTQAIGEAVNLLKLNPVLVGAAKTMTEVLGTTGDFDQKLFMSGVALVHRAVRYQAESNGGRIVFVYPDIVTTCIRDFKERANPNLSARDGFVQDVTALQLSEQYLGRMIEDTSLALELHGTRMADFYGGAWFAYAILKAADEANGLRKKFRL